MKQIAIKIIKRRMIQAPASDAATSANNSHSRKRDQRQIVRRITDWVEIEREQRRSEQLRNLRLYFGDSPVLAGLLR